MTQCSFYYPAELPITARRAEIAELIKNNQVLIIAGETGSGKTTQLPKICLEILSQQQDEHTRKGLIGHTQPRRLAARTVATRIAQELNEQLGVTVGCQVRFQDTSSASTQIKLMTDGILLAEIQRDRLLKKYAVLIIDEAHERSLNIDFLLGYIKLILPKRPDLKLIITSATIELERFSSHFNNAPVITVEGRTYPIEIVYLPPDEMPEKPQDTPEAVEQALLYLLDNERSSTARGGDVLVFLSGEREILETARHLRQAQQNNKLLQHCDIVPLYARLTLSEQQKIFAPHSERRVVLSTNVAETSLTVPGIRYVIDSGYARISRYNHRTRVQRLPIEFIAQASANQRAGRCGRLEAGVCIRLYSEKYFLSRVVFTDAEIHRTNLAAVVLQMRLLRLGEMEDFPFLDPPDNRHIKEAYALLEELGAVDSKRQLTARGRDIAHLPIDPRLGAMLVEAQTRGCLREMLIIASALSVQDPRERPSDKKQRADEVHKQWADSRSDFVSFLKLWSVFSERRLALSQNALRKFCEQNFLSWQRMREWRDIHHQLHTACKERNWPENSDATDYENLPPQHYANLHQALLVGSLSNIAVKQEAREYLGCRQRKLQIFPGSPQAKKLPRWIVSASLIETSQLFAHGIAAIEPQWVLPLAKHLLQHEYFEPFWDEARGMPMVYEKISLYGLVLVDKQKKFYGDIDPQQARELLIREALVLEKYKGGAAFFSKNKALIERVQDMEARIRRRDLLVDDNALFAFYAKQIPAEIVTARELDIWYKKASLIDQGCLLLSEKDVLLRDVGDGAVAQFPDTWHSNGNDLKLLYSFDPGHEQDGVTLQVPLPLLNQISASKVQWLVPGLLIEKCQALLKNLPKALRKMLVPLPNTAERVAALLLQKSHDEDTALVQALREILLRHYSLAVTEQDLAEENIDPYYRMNIKVTGERNTVLAQGRDLNVLRMELSTQAREIIQNNPPTTAIGNAFARSGITTWDFGELPKTLTQQRNDMRVTAYPALQDKGDSAALVLFDTEKDAEKNTRTALVRLAMLALPQQVKQLQKDSLRDNKVHLALGKFGSETELRDDLIYACFAHCFACDKNLPRNNDGFNALLTAGRSQLFETGSALDKSLTQVTILLQKINSKLASLTAKEAETIVQDVKSQLSHLLFKNFLRITPVQQLLQYPRYFEAIEKRLDKIRGQVARDRQLTEQINRYWLPVAAALQKITLANLTPEQKILRWLLEEWRIALFAQPMKTLQTVSEKRLAEEFFMQYPPQQTPAKKNL